jgi:hypothetical protein
LTDPEGAGSTFPVQRFAQASLAAALIAFGATSARGNQNDVELWRLGNPVPITICTLCNGSDNTLVPADPAAQTRFARMTSVLGLSFIPPFHETANTLGQSGFEVGLSGQVAFPRLSPDEWATTGTRATQPAPRALFLPSLRGRKGLGGSLEIGAVGTWLAASRMLAITAEARFAPVDGLPSAPDVGLRVHGTRVIGASSLDLTVLGADLGISKGFGLGGIVRLQPYGEAGVALINAASGVLNFRPDGFNPRDPSAQAGAFQTAGFFHNVYYRGVLGLRMLAGALVLGLEGGLAVGRNPVQSDPPPGGAAPTQLTRLWSASGHLGVAY